MYSSNALVGLAQWDVSQVEVPLVEDGAQSESLGPCPLVDCFPLSEQLPRIAQLLMTSDKKLVTMGLGGFARACTSFRAAAYAIESQHLADFHGHYVGPMIEDKSLNERDKSGVTVIVEHLRGLLEPKVTIAFCIFHDVEEAPVAPSSAHEKGGWTMIWSQRVAAADLLKKFSKPVGCKQAARFTEWKSRHPGKNVPPYSMTIDPVCVLDHEGNLQKKFSPERIAFKKAMQMVVVHSNNRGTESFVLSDKLMPDAHVTVMSDVEVEDIAPKKSRKNPAPEAKSRAYFTEYLDLGLCGVVTPEMWASLPFGSAVGALKLIAPATGGLYLRFVMNPEVRKLAGYDAEDIEFVKGVLDEGKKEGSAAEPRTVGGKRKAAHDLEAEH